MSEQQNTAAEVGVKLVLDSNAKEAAQEFKEHGLNKIDEAAEKTTKGWKSRMAGAAMGVGRFAVGAASMAASAAAAVGAATIGLAVKSAHAFEESEEAVRALAGTFTMIDSKGNPWEKLTEYADDVKNELEEIGIQAGVTDDELVAVFNDIVERGGKSVEAAQELTEQMAYAGRAIPGGAQSLAAGFEQIQMGMVRAKNPIVALISATGTLKGSAKSVAKEMQKMSIDEQMALAEKAIGKMSAKMKDAPMTLSQMGTSMSVAIGNLFEGAGQPIVRALEPVFGKIRDLVAGDDGFSKLESVAIAFGNNIARAVELVNPVIDSVQNAITESWDDIQKAFDAMYGPGKEFFEYIYENKEAFAKTIGDILKMIIKVASFMVRAIAAVRDTISGVLKAIGKSGIVGGDVQKFIGQEEQSAQTKDMRKAILEKGGLSDEDFEKRRKSFVQSGIDSGQNGAEAQQQFDAAYRRAMDDHLAVMKQVEGARDAAITDDAKKFAGAFDVAAQAHDVAAMQYVAQFLDGNASLQNALIKAGPEVMKNFGDLADVLGKLGNKDVAQAIKKGWRPNLGINPKANLVQNFNGPINIKQDFRDEDPDRVALVFRQDMARYGTNRLQSRVATPFGF
jgi:hypothetical protein